MTRTRHNAYIAVRRHQRRRIVHVRNDSVSKFLSKIPLFLQLLNVVTFSYQKSFYVNPIQLILFVGNTNKRYMTTPTSSHCLYHRSDTIKKYERTSHLFCPFISIWSHSSSSSSSRSSSSKEPPKSVVMTRTTLQLSQDDSNNPIESTKCMNDMTDHHFNKKTKSIKTMNNTEELLCAVVVVQNNSNNNNNNNKSNSYPTNSNSPNTSTTSIGVILSSILDGIGLIMIAFGIALSVGLVLNASGYAYFLSIERGLVIETIQQNRMLQELMHP